MNKAAPYFVKLTTLSGRWTGIGLGSWFRLNRDAPGEYTLYLFGSWFGNSRFARWVNSDEPGNRI